MSGKHVDNLLGATGGNPQPTARIRFHDLRHACATHMLALGVHPKIASERLGHSRVAVTLDLYSHVMPGMQADPAARVDEALQAAMQSRKRTLGSKAVANAPACRSKPPAKAIESQLATI